MKAMFGKIAIVLSMICIIAFASPAITYAQSLDDLSSGSDTGNNSPSDENSLSDYLQNYNPITQDNMEQASTLANPIVSLFGTISGFLVMIASAAIFVITGLDLLYIGVPPVRSFLNPKYGMQVGGGAGGMGMGMGGMGMGMGMRGGMGMMGGGAGAPQQAAETGLRRQWVSDEAEYCVNFANRQDVQSGMGGGMMQGGMGMGMGGMGMGMPQQQAQPTPTKSIILMYLKKRAVFLVIFTICTVVLMSSMFTDCGLNLAELLNKVMDKLNGQINSIHV